ncbi:MAG: YtxH domain-containing protein [bacterium]|jgi:gas vesicle protein|nr:YtxH domain-containing protein [Coprothermobacterota bacterium]
MSNSGIGEFFAGIFVGSIIGAGVALLLAPKSGAETREYLKEKLLELKEKLPEQIKEEAKHLKEEAKELMHKGKTLLEEKKTELKEG